MLKERRPSLASNKHLREKVNAVRQEGTAALERMQHDVEFTIMLRFVLQIERESRSLNI